jgi:lipid A 4'-phosphatase
VSQQIRRPAPSQPAPAPARRTRDADARLLGAAPLWLLLCALLLLVAVPAIDIRVAGWFWSAEGGFFHRGSLWERALHASAPVIAAVAVLGPAAFLAVQACRRRPFGRISRAALLLLAVTAIGPGLVVNGVFKEHWGRARPRDVAEFGGDRSFTPALAVSDQCERNCSFTAGDPSVGYALVALAYAFARRRDRMLALAGALALGSLIGLGRLAAGAHFLSDVVASCLIVLALCRFLGSRLAVPPEA